LSPESLGNSLGTHSTPASLCSVHPLTLLVIEGACPMFSSWFQRKQRHASTRSGQPRQSGKRFRPRLEALEDRTVPAVSMALAAAPQTVIFAQPITLTATITSDQIQEGKVPLAEGHVLFQDGNTTLGDVPLPPGAVSGAAVTLPTTPALTIGTHHLTAVFRGQAQVIGEPIRVIGGSDTVLATSDPVDEMVLAPPQPAPPPAPPAPTPQPPPSPRVPQIILRIPGLGFDVFSIDSFSWGLEGPAVTGAGQPHFHQFQFGMRASAQSPYLLVATANGRSFKKATLTIFADADPSKGYPTLTLTTVVVTTHSIWSDGRGGLPFEFCALDYKVIQLTHISGATGSWSPATPKPTPTGGSGTGSRSAGGGATSVGSRPSVPANGNASA
jgi:type VI protein secretion system component Hcp